MVSCSCGEGFNVQYTMPCKKGGFVTWRHNKVRDITAAILSDIHKDVKLQASLLTLNGEEQTISKTVKKIDEVQLDICARSFWVSGQKVFFDVRLFNSNASRYSKQALKQCYSINENEKEMSLQHENNGSGST